MQQNSVATLLNEWQPVSHMVLLILMLFMAALTVCW